MNKYNIDIGFGDTFITDQQPIFNGAFEELEMFHRGRDSVVLKREFLEKMLPQIAKLYPKDASVKIFSKRLKFERTTKIQRIFSWHGLAPKVYAKCYVQDKNGNEYFAQIIEYIPGDYCYDNIEIHNIVALIRQIAPKYHIYDHLDIYPSNIIGSRWVDFGNFDFNNEPAFLADAAVKYNRSAVWGNGAVTAYQQFPELGINSGRDDTRVKMFGLDKFDFIDKTVLDVGSSGGFFTNYCAKRGARAVGVDVHSVAEAAREAANALGYNSEFYAYDLTREHFVETIRAITGLEKFDYMFFLSMDQHIGFKADYFDQLVGKTLFFESNGGKPVAEERELFEPQLKKIFNTVEFRGVSKEGAERNLFICHK